MNNTGLAGTKILIAEDEYTIAEFLSEFLSSQGVQVIGPAGDLKTLQALADRDDIDAAMLDINLGGELVYPLADQLVARGVPMLFTSGYDDSVPSRYADIPRCAKPYRLEALTGLLEKVLAPTRSETSRHAHPAERSPGFAQASSGRR